MEIIPWKIKFVYELDFESKLKLDIQVELEVQTEVIGIPPGQALGLSKHTLSVQCGTCGSEIDQDVTGI